MLSFSQIFKNQFGFGYEDPLETPHKNYHIRPLGDLGMWAGFSYDFSKVKTILANEVIIGGHIGPAITIWLAHLPKNFTDIMTRLRCICQLYNLSQ